MRREFVDNAMRRLTEAEAAFLKTAFVAPVMHGQGVCAQIDGVRCTLSVEPAYQGWGLFRPLSHNAAQLLRPATAAERAQYLSLLAKVHLIVCGKRCDVAEAVAQHSSDPRFNFNSPVEVQLAEGFDLFDSLIASFDDGQLWFDELDPHADKATAAHLRRQLNELIQPALVDFAGMSVGHRLAYEIAYVRRSKAGDVHD